MTHTPGPWEAIRIGGELTGSVFAGKKRICSGICDDVRLVKEAEANSALIEAAPDMLEALEEVVALTENLPVCPFCSCVLDHRPECLSHEIEAAIRKARGEG
jgi:hypothetical protein